MAKEIFTSSDFNGPDGAELHTFDANFVRHASSTTGINAELSPTGTLRQSTNGGGVYYYNAIAPASANYTAKGGFIQKDANAGYAGICLRMNPSTNTWYILQHGTDNIWKIQRVVAGVSTNIATYSHTFTIGQVYDAEIDVVGNTFAVRIDGVNIPALAVTDASPITAAGYSGLMFYVSSGVAGDTINHHLDSWAALQETATNGTAAGGTGTGTGSGTGGTATGGTAGSGTITMQVVEFTTGYDRLSEAGIEVIINTMMGAFVLRRTGLSSDAAKNIIVTDVALTAGTYYRCTTIHSDGSWGAGVYLAA